MSFEKWNVMRIDVDIWISELIDKLQDAFGDRLVLVGIQGSRARDEAKETSDIDSVVVIDHLSLDDLSVYRRVVSSMPHADLACGFVGSPEVLGSWPRHDVFNLVNDTRVIIGSFDFMDTAFTREDALLSAKVGASEIYHALCHTIAFEPDILADVIGACVKNAFFVGRALAFAETGEYPASRARLVELADKETRPFLEAYDRPEQFDVWDLTKSLMCWSEKIVVL